MAVNSRQKGARGERYVAAKFREYGYDAHRTAQFRGNTGQAADVEGIPGIHAEVKFQETLRLQDWLDQAKRDAEKAGDGLPTVFHKKNNAELLVTMEFSTWIQLYREWESGRGDL